MAVGIKGTGLTKTIIACWRGQKKGQRASRLTVRHTVDVVLLVAWRSR